MRALFKAENLLVYAEKAVVILLIFAMVALSFLQVLLRIALNSGIVWLDPLLRYMVLWAGLLGAVLAARYSQHFALEAVFHFIPKKLHRPLQVFAALFTVLASGLLFNASYKVVRVDLSYASAAFYIGNTAMSSGWLELIIPAAFALIALHVFIGVFRPADGGEAKV